MSAENVELVRAGVEAFNRRDFEEALENAHEDLVWKPFFSTETEALRGRAQVLAAWREQVELLDPSTPSTRPSRAPKRRAIRRPPTPMMARPGRVAQWESARFTRERSLVRNQPRPSKKA
jgi:hypothetical protein